jgi:hypothetical protein
MYSSLLFYILYWPFIIGVKKFRVIFDSMDHSVPYTGVQMTLALPGVLPHVSSFVFDIETQK